MSNRKLLFALIALSLPASFVCFYATNLVLSDVANMFYMSLTRDVISSLPIFLIAVEFVLAAITILRAGADLTEQRRLLLNNALCFAVLSCVGAVCAVLSGTMIYGSFTAPYPFPGATILTLIVHLVLIALSLPVIHRCWRPARKKKTAAQRIGRGARWLAMVIFTYYAFDRFGAFLWMPVYVHTANLYRTGVFFLSLLLPVCLLLHHCRYRLGLYRNRKFSGILYPTVYLAADLLLCAAVLTGAANNTQFISAISPALGIERLLSKPIITIIHFVLVTLPILVSLISAICQEHARRKEIRMRA